MRRHISQMNEENGIAMVTALLVTMAVASLALMVVQLSAHNASQSAFDRKRVQAIDAAEAGIDATFSRYHHVTGAGLCGPFDATLPTTPGAQYHVTVQLYSTWPPTEATKISCPPSVRPQAARLVSEGTAVASSSAVAVTRTMQTDVKLDPVFSDFAFSIFSDKQLNLQNKLTINGNIGNDGNVYTNGNFTMGNNTVIHGAVYAQGSLTVNQGSIYGDAWGNNAVALHNLSEFANVLSSTSNITLDNTHVYGFAKALGTITLSNNSVVDGPKVSGANLGPPPAKPFPQITFDQTAVQNAGYVVTNYGSDCTSARNAILAGGSAGVKRALVVSGACSIATFTSGTTIPVRGDTLVFLNGGAAGTAPVFSTQGNVTFQASGGSYRFHVIVPWRSGLPCNPPSPSSYDITFSNFTKLSSVSGFLYTPCTLNFGNNNTDGVNAELIGGVVQITNQLTFTFRPFAIPGNNESGYGVEVSYLREIRNGSTA
ncbi:MAG TPA: pilus assembly PilX N-terminal domain-containing protein [Actinomycetota bacterium]|nr:pilus assembly PilX N-terminal domain-containing protein [Actinomycetota bacterium]